ncbi:MAG: response regulator [Nitrospinae bacterium]|nr:response regulator [Nitrospinota bacterium]MBL7021505.1 response regulator [Nitrospinaceae bacterium]
MVIKVDQILPDSILIVDDSQKIVTLHSKYAKTACSHIKIKTAYDGAAAWEIFQAQPVAVALLDVEMPGMGGVELAEKIFRISPSTSIIVFSGNLTQNTMLKFASLDVDFASKPASEFDVAVKVRSALRNFERDVELERMKVCSRLTSDLNSKQFSLPVIKFLGNLASDPKSSSKIDALRQMAELDPHMTTFLKEMDKDSGGKQKMELLRKIDQLGPHELNFIQNLLASSNCREQIDLCYRVLNPPSPQIQRAINDCLYPTHY